MIDRPIFFPFTHITKNHLETVTAFFPAVDFLTIDRENALNDDLRRFVKTGRINPVFPSEQEMETIDQAAAQYLSWADVHKGNEQNLKAILKESAYFTDDTHVTSIKSRLRRQTDEKSEPREPAWPKQLLFLKLAQLCDAQHDSIDARLELLKKNKEALLNELRGIAAPVAEPEESVMPADSGDKMTQQRIVNWSSYMIQEDRLTTETGWPILVTTSPAVYDWFETNCDEVVNPLDIKKIKVHENKCENQKNWQHRFNKLLMDTVSGKGYRKEDLPTVEDQCSKSALFKLGLFSGCNINPVFNVPGRQIPVCLVNLK